MKKIYYTWIQRGLALLSCAALLLSCAKEGEHPWEDGRDLSHPIELSAGIGIESGTKGPVSGKAFPAGTDGVFFVTAYKGQSAPSDWSAAYFHEQVVNCDADGVLKFATPQYYPANGDKLYFYAYAPKASSITEGGAGAAPAVRYTIDGSQDIIAAQVTGGIAKATAGEQPQPAFAFLHKLKQIKFKVVKDEQFGEGVHLTSLKIVEASTAALLDLANGDLSWDGESTGDLTAYADDAGQEITDESLEVGTPVMMEPGTSFKVQVTAGGVTYNPVEVTLTDEGAGEAGMSHEVTLIFSLQSISYVAAIAEWTDGGSVGAGENDAYPYTIDGNTVVLRDQFGSADPTVYPLHEIWTETPEHEESVWNGTATGKNTYAERFEVARQDVGKMSHSGAKAACAAYSQASGVAGSWRLPTMRELKLIYDLRGGMTNVKAFTDNEVYWSATGTGENSAYLWSLNLKNGGLPDKSYPNESLLSVRCVRDLEQSFSLAYPYVQGGNTVVIKDRFGSADPVNYPTHQPWTITPEHSELAGDANASGYNIFAECFEVASQDIDPSPTSLNAAGACAAYSQASGAAGTWRVPTLQEMLLLTRLSKADELSAVEKIKVGGSSAVYYWTATKDANDNSRTWSVNTSTPHATSRDNNNPLPLRCVRDIWRTLSAPYVADGNTVVVRDRTAANDPSVYPIHENWTETPAHREYTWETADPDNKSGYNTAGERFQVASTDAGEMSWTAAQTACASYREPGSDAAEGDWRLPTMTEWHAIYRLKENLTAANLPSTGVFWATTEFSATNAWSMDINNGNTRTDGRKENIKKVRCIRDIWRTLPAPYVTLGKNVVLNDGFSRVDPTVWPTHENWNSASESAHSEDAWEANTSGKNTYAKRFEVASEDASASALWTSASAACATYSEASGAAGTWRLPTIRELKLIHQLKVPLYKGQIPSSHKYWGLTEVASVDNYAFSLDFSDGSVAQNIKTGAYKVRCVRDF